MPSPFPGMDPYIESSGEWEDFHASLLTAIRDELNARLPSRYRAKIGVYIFVHEPGIRSRRRRLKPDVYLAERADQSKLAAPAAPVTAPTTFVWPRETRKRRRAVLVVDRRRSSVVTVIEILSPSNKEAGDDRTAYLAKRSEYLANRVNVVEIDLLRGGTRLLPGTPPAPPGDYYIMVCRAWQFPEADLWTFTLRDPLPEVPIPLAQDVADTLLPMRACVDRTYDGGSYDTELDYEGPLTPHPRKQDAAWIKSLLASRKKPKR